jgi:hypothetical protein
MADTPEGRADVARTTSGSVNTSILARFGGRACSRDQLRTRIDPVCLLPVNTHHVSRKSRADLTKPILRGGWPAS